MERLNLRIVGLSVVLAATGLLYGLKPVVAHPEGRNEQWMESIAPGEVDGYAFIPSAENAEQSLKMDARSYELLKPYGMVTRIYPWKGYRVEVLLIASSAKESFHDPRVCFTGQGWQLKNQWVERVQTRSRGAVDLTFARMDGPNAADRVTAFGYRGPKGFSATTLGLMRQMFVDQLRGQSQPEGVFYRFIGHDDRMPMEDFKGFIASYLDQANRTSKGFF